MNRSDSLDFNLLRDILTNGHTAVPSAARGVTPFEPERAQPRPENSFRPQGIYRCQLKEFDAAFIALGAALNVSIGYLAGLLKLPLYLDSIGTVLVAVLCGWMYGLLAGLASLIVLSLTQTPTVIAYAGTVLAVAVLSATFARFGYMKNYFATVFGGLVIGLACAAASTPITTFLYGGVSLAGSDAVTTFSRQRHAALEKRAPRRPCEDPGQDINLLICFALVRSLPEDEEPISWPASEPIAIVPSSDRKPHETVSPWVRRPRRSILQPPSRDRGVRRFSGGRSAES